MTSETIATPLTKLLGITHPVLLAPMGGSAGGRLAAAVSEAGGMGMIGGGYADPEWLSAELATAEDSRVGIGFITFALAERPGALDLALERRPPAIQLSFGDPRPYAPKIHAAGSLLICQVQSRAEVALAREAGADVLIAQGQDAGGHGRPDRGTIGLIPSVVDSVSPTPVVAAGGIGDGRGLAAALMLGAVGVAIGTRFLASEEAISSAAEAEGLVAAHGDETARSTVFDIVRGPAWPDGYDGRAVRNELVEQWELADAAPDPGALSELLQASSPDDFTYRPLWAGEGVDLVTAIEPAAEILEDLLRVAIDTIERNARRLDRRP